MNRMPTSYQRRLFLGIWPDQTLLPKLVDLQKGVSQVIAGAKLTKSEFLHLTLYFLGNLEEEAAQRLIAAMGKLSPPAGLQAFDSWIAFPRPAEATIVGIGGKNVSNALEDLHATLGKTLLSLGIETEQRPYHPHLTLARFRNPQRIALEKLPPFAPFELKFTKFGLYESIRDDSGSKYVLVAEVG